MLTEHSKDTDIVILTHADRDMGNKPLAYIKALAALPSESYAVLAMAAKLELEIRSIAR